MPSGSPFLPKPDAGIGTTCPSGTRNLLDFNDITITKTGKILIAMADGCLGPALDAKADCINSTLVSKNTYTQHGAIIRQVSGRGLLAIQT